MKCAIYKRNLVSWDLKFFGLYDQDGIAVKKGFDVIDILFRPELTNKLRGFTALLELYKEM